MGQIKSRGKNRREKGGMREEKRTCPLCGGEQLKRVYTHETGLPLVRCARCELIFFLFPEEAQGADYWKTGGSRYNIEVYSDPAVMEEAGRLYSRYLGWLEAEMGVGKLIDYGCGLGAFLEAARTRGWGAYGLEISKTAVEHARARGLPAWTLEEWRALEPLKEEVDAITMLDVIEHLTDPVETLRSISPFLREGGLILVETPLADYPLKRLSLWLVRLSQGRVNLARFFFYPDHRFYFTLETLERLLKGNDFQVLWARKVTTPRAKVMQKLRKVHRAGRLIRALAWFALQATRLLGGNKILICARKRKRKGSPESYI